jgi:tetratricopeptide (TPR) repeat protein
MQDLTSINFRSTKGRIAAAAAVLFAILFCWFAVRWQIGSMLAGLTSKDSPGATAASELAMRLAPGDPIAKWLRASIEADRAQTGQDSTAVKLIEDAVRLSPYDYRWRIELGRALEQDEQNDAAENEFRRAVQLAPTYAFCHWHLGNFYLRQGRRDEAFAELRQAAQNNQTYREQVFSLAWDYFDKDPSKVEQLAADTPDARAGLALFFAARGRAEDSLRIWNSLNDSDKTSNPQIAKAIAHGLYIQRFFPQALEFARQLGIDAESRPGAVTNAGFERSIGGQEDSRFGWQIVRGDSKLDMATDSTVKHEGSRGLKVSFRNYIKPDLYNIFQTIVAEPNTNYRLSFWVRTETLRSSGGPLLEIINANDDKMIMASKPFPTGTNDWEQINVDFRTPDNCTGVTIRTARVFCGEQCPIVGTLWYDEFLLTGG